MSHPEPPTPEDARAPAGPAGTWRRVARAARVGGGLVLTLLGLFWALQGAEVIRIEPIACAGECQPVTDGSLGWVVIGVLTMLGGLALLAGRRALDALRRSADGRVRS